VDIHAAAFFVVVVRVVCIYGELRKGADQFQALAQRIAHAVIQRVGVVVGIGEDASHHGFHDVAGRRFHDNIAREVRRQRPRRIFYKARDRYSRYALKGQHGFGHNFRLNSQ